MADVNLSAKDYELFGAGFGVLQYNGKPLDLITNFRDQGQPALGSPTDVMTINDVRPRAIIPPMAVASGTFTFDTYGLKAEGLWGSVFNGRFKGAQDLVDLFKQQLQSGAISVNWITTDIDGTPTKAYQYAGVVVVGATRNIAADNRGATQSVHTFTCKYTRVLETTRNS